MFAVLPALKKHFPLSDLIQRFRTTVSDEDRERIVQQLRASLSHEE
mgnify:CR=1 FL=1